MDTKSNGNSYGPASAYGADVPKAFRSRAIADARAMTVTFWDLL